MFVLLNESVCKKLEGMVVVETNPELFFFYYSSFQLVQFISRSLGDTATICLPNDSPEWCCKQQVNVLK